MEEFITTILKIKDISKLICGYSRVCIPNEIKHMKTTWIKWWNNICEQKSSDIRISIKSYNASEKSKWISHNIGRDWSCSYQDASIIKLDETNGNIYVQITGIDEILTLNPIKSYLEPKRHPLLTDFSYTEVVNKTYDSHIDFNIKVYQYEDMDLVDMKSVDKIPKFKNFVKDKRIKILNDSLLSLSDAFSKNEIYTIIQTAHKNLYKIQMENEYKEFIRLYSKLYIVLNNYPDPAWIKNFTNKELEYEVLRGEHWFIYKVDYEVDPCVVKERVKYLLICKNKQVITFKEFVDILIHEFTRTSIYKPPRTPTYNYMQSEYLGSKIFFNGIGWTS